MSKARDFFARSLVAVTLMTVTTVSARADATTDRIAALQAKFRCPIFEYLEAIHKRPVSLENRYLIITIEHRIDERYYAQCAFLNRDSRMLCEVSSPFFNPDFKRTYFSKNHLPLIKALGYRGRRKDNYYQKRDARTPEALYDIAGLLVDTVGRIFDMQTDEGLMYEAPLVVGTPPSTDNANKFCLPLVSLR